jgi:hypothetical protein
LSPGKVGRVIQYFVGRGGERPGLPVEGGIPGGDATLPADRDENQLIGFGSFGATGVQQSCQNFWADIEGKGKEADWGDLIDDGLLMHAMQAQVRAQRGDPPQPEDEFLFGRQRANPSPSPASSADLAWVVAVVLFGLTVTACMC